MQLRKTRQIYVGTLAIGGGAPVSVQSMCATKTRDVEATVAQIALLEEHGADIIRVAVDTRQDVEALSLIRKRTGAILSVDLQENYRLAELVAPYVQKIRYNPGHLHHHESDVPVRDKVGYLVEIARRYDLALRIGINAGSMDPALVDSANSQRPFASALRSASEHVAMMDDLKFENFLVSLKSSDPNEVIEVNRAFAAEFPAVPLHLGVTEAGLLPMGEVKTRAAFENLLYDGIGETIRVSLTLPNNEKHKEIIVARKILSDLQAGRVFGGGRYEHRGLNIVSCPSCSRVENGAFVELAEKVRSAVGFASEAPLTIAVMGCRVNGPGESDDADIGLWCAANHVNLKRRGALIGAFSYTEVLMRLEEELRSLMAESQKTENSRS